MVPADRIGCVPIFNRPALIAGANRPFRCPKRNGLIRWYWATRNASTGPKRHFSPCPARSNRTWSAGILRKRRRPLVREVGDVETTAFGWPCVPCGLRAAVADTLDVQLFPLSGEIRFHNPNVTAVPFVYYSVSSITNHVGALNPTNPQWQSISDYYDASGNGFIDAMHDWTKLSATSTQLTEGVFSPPGTGGSLPALRSVTLGQIWNPGVVPSADLAFDIEQDTQAVTLNIQLAVAGDYDHNGTVNMADYTVWRQNFGSTTALDADGNINGVVDAGDYAIWRKNFGNSLPGAGSSLGLFSGAVPEPTAAALIWLAGSALLLQARPRPAA